MLQLGRGRNPSSLPFFPPLADLSPFQTIPEINCGGKELSGLHLLVKLLRAREVPPKSESLG